MVRLLILLKARNLWFMFIACNAPALFISSLLHIVFEPWLCNSKEGSFITDSKLGRLLQNWIVPSPDQVKCAQFEEDEILSLSLSSGLLPKVPDFPSVLHYMDNLFLRLISPVSAEQISSSWLPQKDAKFLVFILTVKWPAMHSRERTV